jgi:hypothetical protein
MLARVRGRLTYANVIAASRSLLRSAGPAARLLGGA